MIQDLYFTGGVTAFANRFLDLFPTHQTTDGPTREAPVVMVALAATSVSSIHMSYLLKVSDALES